MIIPTEDVKIIKRVIGLLKPYTKKIIGIMACIILSAGISMLLPLISKELMDKGLLQGNYGIVVRLSLATLFLIMVEQCLAVVENRNLVLINSLLSFALYKRAFKHTLRLKMNYFNNSSFWEIMSNVGMDVTNITGIADRNTFFIIAQIFRMIGGMVGLLIIDWKLMLFILLIIPLRYVVVKYLARRRKELFEQLMEKTRAYSSWYGDTLSGVKEVKLMGLERIKIGEFIKKQREIVKINIELAMLDTFNHVSEYVFFGIISNALYIIGTYMILFRGSLTIGGMIAFIGYSSYVTGPISAILNIGYNFSNIVPSARRFFDFLQMECEADITGQKLFCMPMNSLATGSITFAGVSFAYNPGEPILEDISFEVKQGQKVAIIGTNGSGKTTLLNLLLRFNVPQSGQILLGGQDIATIKLKDYRSQIAVVSQEIYLFNTTIEKNITLYAPVSDADVRRAAQASGALEFIESLPERFDTHVGNNGMTLSGGERQKIAMARALARDAKILVLDEATSHYDVESEIQVNNILNQEYAEKTAIIITHKPEILKRVDQIIVLSNGQIEDMGNHDELYARNSLYREMVTQKIEQAQTTS